MGWVMKMDKEKELPKRKPTRLQAFDYNTTGAYFITICTDKRRQILSRIVGVDVLGDPQNVELLSHGMVADKYIKQMNEFYENITVDQYVIMPNHIHLILFVHEDGSPRTSTPTKQTSFVSHFVSTFKLSNRIKCPDRFLKICRGYLFAFLRFIFCLNGSPRTSTPTRRNPTSL